jgi:TetR/AcrR family transcriptional repressor of nem operon
MLTIVVHNVNQHHRTDSRFTSAQGANQMKVSRKEAARHRERIVEVAAKLFREKGFDNVGVDDLMKAAGLSRGGFYGHFESKEHLIREACEVAAAQNLTWIRAQVHKTKSSPKKILDIFLSPDFCDAPGSTCLTVALGSEISRRDHVVRRIFEEYIKDYLEVLTGAVAGASKAKRRSRAMTTYAAMVGAVVLARAVDGTSFSKYILRTVRKSLANPHR